MAAAPLAGLASSAWKSLYERGFATTLRVPDRTWASLRSTKPFERETSHHALFALDFHDPGPNQFLTDAANLLTYPNPVGKSEARCCVAQVLGVGKSYCALQGNAKQEN